MFTIKEINNMSKENFSKTFENIVENFSTITQYLIQKRPFKNIEELEKHIDEYLNCLDLKTKEDILRSHPDLAGRLFEEGKLTKESEVEQKHAGLDKISLEERELIKQLNNEYKQKNDFPFVICARENKIKGILEGLKNRFKNNKEDEINIGINEVKKICKLRTRDLIIEK